MNEVNIVDDAYRRDSRTATKSGLKASKGNPGKPSPRARSSPGPGTRMGLATGPDPETQVGLAAVGRAREAVMGSIGSKGRYNISDFN